VAPHVEPVKYTYDIGGFAARARIFAFANSIGNMTSALYERVFFHEIGGVFTVPSDPSIGEVGTALRKFRTRLLARLPRATPLERHMFVSLTYRGRKLAVYKRAAENLDRRGLRVSDSYLTTFLKLEKLVGQNKRQVPRVIQPRRPEYNVELGRYLHPIEHDVYVGIDHTFGHPTVMKGLNSSKQGTIIAEAWAQFQRPCALCIDASRFDQHIRTGLLSWEHSVYAGIFNNDPYLARLLSWQLKSTGFARVGGKLFQYKVRGGRCSGDMNTAMGNILVACATVYSWLDSLAMVKKVRVLDAGDDCMIFGEAADIERIAPTLQPWFAKLGLIMKVEPLVYTLEQVSFCQTQPVYDGSGWRMVRDPHVSLSKDSCVLRRCQLQNLTSHFIGIGDCGLALTGGLPVLQEYYMALGAGKACSRPVDEELENSGFFRLARGMVARYRPVTDDARHSFWRAFGIPPDLQIELEQHYRSCNPPAPYPVYGAEVRRVDLGGGIVKL
jgi:hypothetical protein